MSSRVFSIPPQSQKFESRADIESHLVKLRAIKDVEEIHLGGNSYGVDACLAVADELKRINTLKVGQKHPVHHIDTCLDIRAPPRSPILQTSSLDDSSPRSRSH